ncbi:alkaline phosphatase [Trichocoleus sp. FACHB-90]|uniref:alkaline phosphatase D family protein n=1 Tax=Cyanophyceae TaxID=3028117 RepID=UPI0016878E2D|nr:alkaline phosphatase [Trichocoleus sp. FACHB-90]MBD1927496.1 alkaline phosphatase [Trichocoleus sp. FACHB-90]
MDGFDFERLLSTRLRRRGLLVGGGALTGLAIATQFSSRVVAQPRFSGYPFTLGVASGDPLPDSVVLWTRLAPDPLNGGGMPSVNVPVQWQIATDENMSKVVLRGTAIATPELGHSIRVVVGGLQPDRWYWYQFKAGNEVSRIGRTRTAPAFGTPINQLNFAFASCQDWQNGYYTAYKHLAEENLNFVVHLGDYIYEYGPLPIGPRQHNSPEIVSLSDYRNRHALYKTDPNLQAAHAAFPWIVTWDDHEVENDYADLIPEDGQSPQAFVNRRANAYKAYYEHMPLRAAALPKGADMRLYRRLTFGDLAEFNVLDTRQYRSDQPCGDGFKPRCAEAFAADATMTGREQEQWLLQGLSKSQTRWNVIAQQVMMAEYDFVAGTPEIFNLDAWDGYVASRNRILGFIKDRKPNNPVVLTGDIHSSWVHDLKPDFQNPASPTVATEFVGTSITSDFPTAAIASVRAALPENPHTKFFDGQYRGYVRCNLTRNAWQTDFRVVSTILDPNASISTLASFVVENGRPGAMRV